MSGIVAVLEDGWREGDIVLLDGVPHEIDNINEADQMAVLIKIA